MQLGDLLRTIYWRSAPLRAAVFSLNTAALSRLGRRPVPPVAAYCVYRARNSGAVERLVNQLGTSADFHLHCLEGPPEGALVKLTQSIGPGMRMPLIQSLIDRHPASPGQWTMIFDDDFAFDGTKARRFLEIAALAGFDISQPGHSPTSPTCHRVTRARPLSLARTSRFVEVGPVVLMSPRATARLTPFPADVGMGWGLDIAWSLLTQEGFRLGIVDATPIRHFGSIGAGYTHDHESAMLNKYLSLVPQSSLAEVTRGTGAVWRPWMHRAPWTDHLIEPSSQEDLDPDPARDTPTV